MNDRAAALDFVTRCLGSDRDPEEITTLRSHITSADLVWQSIADLANHHLVTPALWAALNEKELVDQLPEDVREYLKALHQLNGRRNEHLKRQIVEVTRRLNDVGIKPVLLKGAVHLFSNTFSDPASRVMIDLDILVPQEKLNTCLNILKTLGYRSDREQQAKHAHHHHCAPLFRPGDYGTIEIHRDPIYPAAAHLLPTRVAWEHVEPLEVEGLEMNVLSPSYRILHNILHSEIIDRNYASGLINLRSLHETVVTNLKHGKKIDWLDLQTLMDYHGKGDVLRAYLYLAHRLFGMKIPDGIRPTLRCTAHYVRSRAQLRSVWVTNWITRWVSRIHEFSTYSICGRYGYDAVPIWLAIGRLRYACNLLSRLVLKGTANVAYLMPHSKIRDHRKHRHD